MSMATVTFMFIVSDDYWNRPSVFNMDGDQGTNMTSEEWSAFIDETEVPATQYQYEVHYKTHYNWTVGVIASTIICTLCVLPSY